MNYLNTFLHSENATHINFFLKMIKKLYGNIINEFTNSLRQIT